MNRNPRISLLFISLFFMGISCNRQSNSPNKRGWDLVWNDEFDNQAIDLSSWTFDIGTGAPAFVTSKYMRATKMTGQMSRFYGLPIRSSNTCVSNTPDNQATWESSNSLSAAITSVANMVYQST